MLIFILSLNISGTLVYNAILLLMWKKKGRSKMKSETQFLRKSSELYEFLRHS